MTAAPPDTKAYLKRIAAIATGDELDAVEHELFGRKNGLMTVAMKELKDLPEGKKKAAAKQLNAAKAELVAALADKGNRLSGHSDDDLLANDRLDVTLNLPEAATGHLHLVPEFIAQVEDVFGRLGFDVAYGPEIETEDYNFNKLNLPEEHPARDGQDTFWIKTKDGRERVLLRTQTSPVQIRYMAGRQPPFRMVCPGKVYRKDSDATHSPMFHQFEGLMVGEDVSLANLKAVLIGAVQELIGRDIEFRFRTGYFPFVEPGLEMDIKWQGDLSASREGKWLEMGGCGLVHPNVLRNVDIDPDRYQGFAFGFGVERLLMIKHQIPDLRAFYQGDLAWLKQF